MKRIDSPTDVALTQYEGEPQDTTQEIILKIASKLFLPIGLATALRDHFSAHRRYERIHQVFLAFRAELDSLRKESVQDTARTQAIEERLQSPKFTEAILTAAEEAARTADSNKLNRLACVLANGLNPNIIQPEDDLPSLVRDVSQLSERDIKTLNFIVASPFQGWLASFDPKTGYLGQHIAETAAREKIESDDFYSTAYRLVGFGLALEAPTQTGRRSADNLHFVPTKRGRKLIELLKKRC